MAFASSSSESFRPWAVGNALRGVPGGGVAACMAIRGTPRRAFPTANRRRFVHGRLARDCVTALCLVLWAALTASGQGSGDQRWVHPLCKPLATDRNGPIVDLGDGSLATVDKQGLHVSKDDGRTWSEARPIHSGAELGHAGNVGQIVRTRKGAIVVVYLDFDNYQWQWDDAKGAPARPGSCRLEVWAIRSTDGGKTWTDRQRLLDGYNADFTGFIQTRSGRLVVTLEHLTDDPPRWIVCSFVSDDEGKTWKRSNWIDLGGHGHHDGATEPTLAELSDGRLLMLIRTSLDRFWEAYSDDDGRYWRIIRPSGIDASSSPGYLLRLRSGRLVLAWNRLNPEGGTCRRAPPRSPASEVAISWFREELSLAFSADDGKTWTPGVVIARQKGGQLAYPYLFERRSGQLWIFTRYTWDSKGKDAPSLRVRVDEDEFLRETKKKR